jgi:hypothetical protein
MIPLVALGLLAHLFPAPAVETCDGPDQRLYGTTCCTVEKIDEHHKYPGMTFLTCRGPQVGKACHSKRDCDVACSCDGDSPGRPGDRHGPKDGTKGVTGRCADSRQIGVWMCDIDEKGVVTHLIVD